MNFIHETGAIISTNGMALAYFDGTPGNVDFDIDLITQLHKASPGCIWKFAHTHPLRMSSASEVDRMMMRTLAPVLYPFPVRLSVITSLSRDYEDWREITYLATLQSKTEWKKSGNKFRELSIIEEKSVRMTPYALGEDFSGWQQRLLERSYEL